MTRYKNTGSKPGPEGNNKTIALLFKFRRFGIGIVCPTDRILLKQSYLIFKWQWHRIHTWTSWAGRRQAGKAGRQSVYRVGGGSNERLTLKRPRFSARAADMCAASVCFVWCVLFTEAVYNLLFARLNTANNENVNNEFRQ